MLQAVAAPPKKWSLQGRNGRRMVVVERQASRQDPVTDPNRSHHGAPRKIQSPSCSAISVHSDDETVNFTGCTELSAGNGIHPSCSGRFLNAHEIFSNGTREYQDNSSPESNHWDSNYVHSRSAQSNESALSAMLAGISSPLHRMEAPAKSRQRNFKRAEQAANLLEFQLDEVESSHGSYEVPPLVAPLRLPT
jgi:hypothetical protein